MAYLRAGSALSGNPGEIRTPPRKLVGRSEPLGVYTTMNQSKRPTGHLQVKIDKNGRTRSFWAFWRDRDDRKGGRRLGPAHVRDSGRRTARGAVIWRAGHGPEPSPEYLTPKEAQACLETIVQELRTAAEVDRAVRWLDANPLAAVKRASRRHDHERILRRDDFYDPDEVDRLLRHAPGVFEEAFWLCGAHAGLRLPGEALGLRWGAVDFQTGVMRPYDNWVRNEMDTTKTSDSEAIPMTPRLTQALAQAQRTGPRDRRPRLRVRERVDAGSPRPKGRCATPLRSPCRKPA